MPDFDAALLRVLADATRGFVSASIEPLHARIRELDAELRLCRSCIDGLPAPRDGKDAVLDPEMLRSMVALAVDAIPRPENGSSVSIQDVEPMLRDLVAARVSEIPPVAAERVDMDQVRALVGEAVAALPPPANGDPGSSVTIADLAPLLDEQVPAEIRRQIEAAVAALPPPRDGTNGEAPDPAEIEAMVARSVSEAVARIPRAADGEPGRDALQIELMPAIDPARVYPRGVYAQHEGGIWRSYQRTAGMLGWECVLQGIAGAEISQGATERHISLQLRMSSGEVVAHELLLPLTIYRGTYEVDKQYERGDIVTRSGSQWHANEPTTEPPEPGCAAWTLSTKRGERGRDAEGAPTPPPRGPVRIA